MPSKYYKRASARPQALLTPTLVSPTQQYYNETQKYGTDAQSMELRRQAGLSGLTAGYNLVQAVDPTGLTTLPSLAADIYNFDSNDNISAGNTVMDAMGSLPLGTINDMYKSFKASSGGLGLTGRQRSGLNKAIWGTKGAAIAGRLWDAAQVAGGAYATAKLEGQAREIEQTNKDKQMAGVTRFKPVFDYKTVKTMSKKQAAQDEATADWIRGSKAYGGRIKKYQNGGTWDSGEDIWGPMQQEQWKQIKVPQASTGGGGIMNNSGLAGSVSGIMGSLLSLMDKPTIASSQPLVNPMTMQAMYSPYAFGGSLQDLSEDELAQVQDFADQNGITVDDALSYMNSQMYQQDTENMPQTYEQEEPDELQDIGDAESAPQFASGGWIKKAAASIKRRGTKGKCTPITKPGCTGRARALALTFKKIARKRKKHAMGGTMGYGGYVAGSIHSLNDQHINDLTSKGYKIEYV